MSDYLLNRELEAVKQDKEAVKVQLEVSRLAIAKQRKQKMKDLPITSYVKPIKKKKPIKVKWREFVDKIKIILGITKDDIQ